MVYCILNYFSISKFEGQSLVDVWERTTYAGPIISDSQTVQSDFAVFVDVHNVFKLCNCMLG